MRAETVQKLLELNKKIITLQNAKIEILLDFTNKIATYAQNNRDIVLGVTVEAVVKKFEEKGKETNAIIKQVADLKVEMEKEQNENV